MLRRIEVEMVRDIAVHEGGRSDHLGVQASASRDETEKEPAMPIGPVHHRRDAKAMRSEIHAGL